jgi:hypothetical protein
LSQKNDSHCGMCSRYLSLYILLYLSLPLSSRFSLSSLHTSTY